MTDQPLPEGVDLRWLEAEVQMQAGEEPEVFVHLPAAILSALITELRALRQSKERTEPSVGPKVTVEEIETSRLEGIDPNAPGEPLYRVNVGGCCFDFDSEPEARNLQRAILRVAEPSVGWREDEWRLPPPHFKPDPRWQRQPQSAEEWDRHQDPPGDGNCRAKRRLAFAGDCADPRAPRGMALVSRWDVCNILGRLTWLEARFENTRATKLPDPEAPSPAPSHGGKEGAMTPALTRLLQAGPKMGDPDMSHPDNRRIPS